MFTKILSIGLVFVAFTEVSSSPRQATAVGNNNAFNPNVNPAPFGSGYPSQYGSQYPNPNSKVIGRNQPMKKGFFSNIKNKIDDSHLGRKAKKQVSEIKNKFQEKTAKTSGYFAKRRY